MSIFPSEFTQSIYKSGRSTWVGFVIVIVVAIISAVIVNQVFGPLTDDKDVVNFILLLNVTLTAGLLIFGFRVYNSRIRESIAEGRHLPDKLNRYRSAIAVFLVICTFPIFIALLCFVFTGNIYIFVIVAMCFGAILMKAPTRSRAISELQLTSTEKKEFTE
jgi:peptidoglycan/LPS O-acetylase OafA/YrhL